MPKTFAVTREPGPAWVVGVPMRQQPLWAEHAQFMDALFTAGHIVLGGPYADESGVLLIVTAHDNAAVLSLWREDPWVVSPILPVKTIQEWTLFLDARKRA
jgi:hypothetical protein